MPSAGASGRRVQPQLLGLGIVVLLLRDVAGRQHAVEHHVAARQAGVRVHLGIKIGGRLRDAYERGGLRERQVERRHLEVVLRGRFDAVAAVPVVDDVQVLDQDVVFAEAFLQIDGQLGLADLALEGDVGRLFGQHGVAHELLGDGGSASRLAAAQVVEPKARRDTGDVHGLRARRNARPRCRRCLPSTYGLISSYVTGSRFSSWNSASNVASSPAYITDSRDVLVKSVSSMLGRFFVQPSMTPRAP